MKLDALCTLERELDRGGERRIEKKETVYDLRVPRLSFMVVLPRQIKTGLILHVDVTSIKRKKSILKTVEIVVMNSFISWRDGYTGFAIEGYNLKNTTYIWGSQIGLFFPFVFVAIGPDWPIFFRPKYSSLFPFTLRESKSQALAAAAASSSPSPAAGRRHRRRSEPDRQPPASSLSRVSKPPKRWCRRPVFLRRYH